MSLINQRNKFFFLFSIIAFVVGTIIKGHIYEPAVFVIFVAFISAFLLILIGKSNSVFLTKIIIISVLIKITTVFIMEYIMVNKIGIPFISYKDDYVYDEVSSAILNAWRTRGFGFYDDLRFGTGFYSGYPIFSAFGKYLFGDHYLVPRFMNVFFSTLTIPFFYKSLKYYTSDRLARSSTVLFALSGVFIVYSSLQLKDTILVFFLSVLVYGTVKFFNEGFNLKIITTILIAIVFLIFFRAALLLVYVVALATTTLLVKNKNLITSKKVVNIFGFLIIIGGFFFIWDYLYRSGFLGLTGEEYFESRISLRGEESAYQGSNDLTKLGPLAIIAGPALVLISVFLPTPVFVKLNTFSNIVDYHFLPAMEYYGILPMVLVGLIFILKNYRTHKAGLFILLFLVLYKIGQAGSKSIFDTRQSLPAIYMSYMILGFFDMNNSLVRKIWKRYKTPVVILMILVMFGFTYSRILIRQ